MGERLQEALDAGAIGMSTGLYYAPAFHAPPAEIEALAALLRPAGALYTTHMRDESRARARQPRGELRRRPDGRRAGGDLAPQDDRRREFRPHRRDPAEDRGGDAAAGDRPRRLSLYRLLDRAAARADRGRAEGADHLVESRARNRPAASSTTIARDWGVESILEAAARLQPAGAIYWMMDEADVRRVLAFEQTMIGSDGLPHDIHPHPRLWGTFPRVLGHYCREVGLFGLEEAVRKMTGLSAARFGLAGRGVVARRRLCRSHACSIAETVIDRATFAEPTLPAAGIEHVFVNGRPVWSEGKPTGERPGRALRRQQMQERRVGEEDGR